MNSIDDKPVSVRHEPLNSRHQILALSGGGYRGLYTINFLAHCEKIYSVRCINQFDLFTGTSIGALIVAGLAVGKTAEELVNGIEKYGMTVIHKTIVHWVKRLFVQAPYDLTVLERVVREILGEKADLRLNSIDVPLLIPTVNYSTGKTVILKSYGACKNFSHASKLTLTEAVLASSVAPTYFSNFKLKDGTDEYVDGGLVANSPDLIAFNHEYFSNKIPLKDINMLSIGTAGRKFGSPVRSKPIKPSVLSWLFFRRLIQTNMTVQEDMTLREISSIPGERHLRIDCEPKKNQEAAIREIDYANKAATDTLESLAVESFEEIHAQPRFRAFFRDFSDEWLAQFSESNSSGSKDASVA